jgi:hypothetical protein
LILRKFGKQKIWIAVCSNEAWLMHCTLHCCIVSGLSISLAKNNLESLTYLGIFQLKRPKNLNAIQKSSNWDQFLGYIKSYC